MTSTGLADLFWSEGRWVTVEARVGEGLMTCAASGVLHGGIIQTEPAAAAGPHAPHLLREFEKETLRLQLIAPQIQSTHIVATLV